MLTLPERSLPITSSPGVMHGLPVMTPAMMTSTPANTLGLEEVWRRLWRQKWLFLLTLLGTLLLTVLITWSIAPSYRAIATIQIEKEGVRVVDFGNLKTATPDQGELDPFFRTQYEQLKSRKLAEQLIDELDLNTRLFERKEKPGLIRGWLLGIRDSLSALKATLLPASDTAPLKPDRVNDFLNGLYVEPIEKTHLVKVYYESPDPALSAQIVNTLVDTFIHNSINSASETDNYAQSFLERELEKARTRLKNSENELVTYARDNEILEVNNSQATQERKLDELYSALGEAERRRIEAESQLGQARQHGNVAGVLSNPVVEALKRQLVDLEAEYQNQSKLFKPAYPDMQQLAQQIESVRSKLGREVGNLKQSLEAEFTAASRLEGRIRSELNGYKGELTNLRDRSVEYNALKREVDNNRKLYDDLLQRMSEVNVAAGVNNSNISIIDRAVAPREKFRPRRALNLLIGLLTGLMLASGLALLLEALRRTVRSGDELQSLSGLPVLGTIPHVRRMSGPQLAMMTALEPDSPVAEAYRIAATNLRFALPGGPPRIVLLTSVNPAEGKSTSSINLAVSKAQMGAKVLLIDADLRRPTVLAKMGLMNQRGLSDYIDGKADLVSTTQTVPGIKGLYVISAGNQRTDPMRTLANPRMRELLELAKKHFDITLIDAPPVTGFADALMLGSLSDATVVVTDQDRIDRKQLMAVIHQLNRVRQNVAGFLVVKAQREVASARYYDRYRDSRPAPAPVVSPDVPKGINLGRPR